MELHYLLLLISLIAVGLCQTHDIHIDEIGLMLRTSRNNKSTYCGKHLTAMLSQICNGHYNPPRFPDVYSSSRSDFESSLHGSNIPFRSKRAATAMLSNHRRTKRRGVYNECCEKPCSRDELASYCGKPSRR